MHNCPAHQFGCSCAPGECQSATSPLRKAITAADTVAAKARADMVLLRTIAVMAVASIFLSFTFVGLPEMERWQKKNQENIASWR